MSSNSSSERPQPSLQDILASDVIPPPEHMRQESQEDFGNEDISIDRYISKAYHDMEVEKVWRKTWQ